MYAKVLIFPQFSIPLHKKINIHQTKLDFNTMKSNILALAAMALVACPVFMSCSDDPERDAIAPTFKEVVIEPSNPSMGDTVTATIKFLSEGHHWYEMKYNWILSRSGQESQYFITNSEKSVGQKEPTFQFVVPDTVGNYTLTVRTGIVQASSLFANGALAASATIQNGAVHFNVAE